MDEDSVAKYIASHQSLLVSCDNLFQGQQHFHTEGMEKNFLTTFRPELFIASNTKELFKGKNSKIIFNTNKKSNIPHEVFYMFNDIQYRLISNGKFGKQEEFVATSLFLEMSKEMNVKMDFNYKGYYTVYNEYIDFNYNKIKSKCGKIENLLSEVSQFYIEYGYWNGLFFTVINGLNYIASYRELINEYRNDEQQGLIHYFNKGIHEGKIITFRPEVYILSNIEKLKDLVEKNGPKLKEATNHYIMNGCFQDLPCDSFNHFDYLANNPKRIRFLLTSGDEVIWDFNKLVKSVAARDYLMNFGNVKKRKFDSVDFVKRYVGDKKINFDGKLSLENASFYFVRGYVTHKSLRRTLTGWSRFKRFMNNRFEDGLRQIPFSITKFVIENKFL